MTEPNIRRTVLANGVRLATERMPHVRSVAVGIWLTRGSRHEPSEHSGIAHFKAGFGGEEVKYVGAWETAVSPAGRIVALANSMRARYVKLRHGRWATRGR